MRYNDAFLFLFGKKVFYVETCPPKTLITVLFALTLTQEQKYDPRFNLLLLANRRLSNLTRRKFLSNHDPDFPLHHILMEHKPIRVQREWMLVRHRPV